MMGIDIAMKVENLALASYMYLHAIRLDYLFRETPCVIASRAKIDALEHQLIAVKYMLSQNPIRIMLADDVGLGKTIMAGLLLRELMLRGRVSRALIVVPKSLLFQWKRELEEKFGFSFNDGEGIIITSSKDLEKIDLEHASIVLISIDLLKRKTVLDKVASIRWDIAIFDEAHNLTIKKYRNEIRKTQRYEAAEKICILAPNVLLLTATPHHGKFEDFVYRLRLLDPNVPEDKYTIRRYISHYVIRRLREDVVNEYGERLIPDRISYTITIGLDPEEREFYKEITKYVIKYFNVGFERRSRVHIWAAFVFQKRASSSIYAIVMTLRNRIKKLKSILRLLESGKLSTEELENKIRRLASRRELKELMKYIVLNPTEEGLQEEISILENLLRKGEELLRKGIDSKFDRLLEIIENVKQQDPERKFVIFTSYRATLEYLKRRLEAQGYKVTFIHGGLSHEERIKAEEKLRRECDIMVATDAASEGLNLQVASVLINYDLPWNPTRLDQRIGRVHRYGQKKTVYVYNILVSETIDNRVYEILMRKIEEIKQDLGKVYDYLGTLITYDQFRKLVIKLLQKGFTKNAEEEVDKDLDKLLKKKTSSKAKLLEDLIDKNRIRLEEFDPRCRPEDIVDEDDVENFVVTSIYMLDPKQIERREEKGAIVYSIRPPYELSKVAKDTIIQCIVENGVFKREYLDRVPYAQYIGLEHPLVQALIRYWRSQVPEPIKLVAECDRAIGTLLIFEIKTESRDMVPLDIDRNIYRILRKSQIVPIMIRHDGSVTQPPLSIIKNFINIRIPREVEIQRLLSLIEDYRVRNSLKNALNKLVEELKHELDIIREEVRSRYTAEMEYIDRKIKKVSMKNPEEARILESKRNEIFRRMYLHIMSLNNIEIISREPRLIAVIKLIPPGFIELGLDKVEKAIDIGKKGEEIVKRFEEMNGCEVIDMRENFVAGFDFISICRDGIKYIEVKTVSHEYSKIYITQCEWKAMTMSSKARHRYVANQLNRNYRSRYIAKLKEFNLQDHYHLYIVDLRTGKIIDIRNPAANLWRLFDSYRQEYIKIVISYGELLKIIKVDGNFVEYDVKELLKHFTS